MPSFCKTLLVPSAAVAFVWFFALLTVLYSPAFAQGRVCADDVAKFCQGVKGGQAKLMQCLKAHQSELSSPCQARVQTIESRMKEMSEACQSDMQQFCPGVNPSGGRIAQCLRRHESELSSTCKAELAQARSRRQSAR
jgi:Golgi apparatus protein 1